jgi:small subunit ribosomal protein S9
MADDRTPPDEETPEQQPAEASEPAAEAPSEPAPPAAEEPVAEEPAGEEPAPAEEPVAEEPAGEEPAPAEEPVAEEPAGEEPAPAEEPVAEEPAGEEPVAEEPAVEEPVAEEPAAEEPAAEEPAPAEAPVAEQPAAATPQPAVDEDDEEEPAPRVKPEIPGADLEVDIVTEGADPLGRERSLYDEDDDGDDAAPVSEDADDIVDEQPIAAVTIDLAAGARYRATGKRKTAVARVILRPGTGAYVINGRTLEVFFPRSTLQRNIRQPLEAVGYEERMDVVARLHGGGVAAQAGALRHGISRALLEADPNLRGELKRRGFLTRDPRVKERKKAGLKKARKRPQFSKR